MPSRKDQGRQQGKVAADGGYESRGDWRRRAVANSMLREQLEEKQQAVTPKSDGGVLLQDDFRFVGISPNEPDWS